MFLLAGLLYMVIIYVVGQGINWLDRRARIT
jgi:polar amino acid transport system permease protein